MTTIMERIDTPYKSYEGHGSKLELMEAFAEGASKIVFQTAEGIDDIKQEFDCLRDEFNAAGIELLAYEKIEELYQASSDYFAALVNAYDDAQPFQFYALFGKIGEQMLFPLKAMNILEPSLRQVHFELTGNSLGEKDPYFIEGDSPEDIINRVKGLPAPK